ncbi:MAG: hypothetical protein HY513_04770 [Candidatus Aenigmarchaeota archaeon]|nr:hypothetical protein [Candidatus Aenigmarchaeota archaeon]
MAALTEVKLETLNIQKTMSVYPLHGRAYLVRPYSVDLSSSLVKTGRDYYDSQELLAKMIANGELSEGTRFSTSAEELALQKSYEMQGKDPRKAEEFKDHMGKGKQGYVWGYTLTGLRVPEGWQNGKKDTGTNKYPRIVLLGDEEKDLIQVPEGGGKVIVEYDDVFGVATEVRGMPFPHKGYNAHWHFNPSPRLDEKTGHYDVAVGRRGDWHHGEDARCLNVGADYGRWLAGSYDGFRPVVRGSVPEIEVVDSNVDIEQVRQEIEKKLRADIATELRPLKTLFEKYK